MTEVSVSMYCGDPAVSVRDAVRTMLGDIASVPVILCIGSDKVTGDCLGPLTGYFLTKRLNVPAYVYGTLESPVTARNLESACKFISGAHRGSRVLAVDAALGDFHNIGMMFFRRQGVFAGSAMNKAIPRAGDYSVTAVVNSGGIGDSAKLFSTSINTVIKLAETIAHGINSVCEEKARLCV